MARRVFYCSLGETNVGVFAKGRQSFADGVTAWNTNRLLCYLLDVDDLGPSAGAWKVSNATIPSGSTVRLTTQANHGLTAGDEVEVWGIGGVTNTTGIFSVLASNLTATQFEFTASTTPTGTYTSGGYLINLSAPTFMSDINVSGTADIAKVAIPTSGRTTINGYLDAPNLVFSNVSGDIVEAFCIVRAAATDADTSNDTTESAQRLILCQTPATSGLTGLPQTPVNANINIDFAAQGITRI